MLKAALNSVGKNIFKNSLVKGDLIETKELAQIIQNGKMENVKVLDCSFFMPNDPRSATELFKKERIPYSQFFDIDEIADKSTNLPHMMAEDSTFIEHMKKMDIRIKDQIICYDRQGVFSSPRVWFNFKIFGCKNVAVLNGGFPKWQQEGLPLEKGNEYLINTIHRDNPTSNDFNYKQDKSKVLSLTKALELSKKVTKKLTDEQIIDCRAAPRYKGEVEEPRPTIRRGHLEGAQNVFFRDLLDDNMCFKSPEEIRKIFVNKGIDLNRPMTLYCGSGTSACVDIFALNLIDLFDKCRLYDGSWAELGNITQEELKNRLDKIRI